ncbi:MAG: hypothetical protein HY399_05305 [Elusimicrobia bacterium]|nr:hypothetical protein [Elusimicrobiota bacterium]
MTMSLRKILCGLLMPCVVFTSLGLQPYQALAQVSRNPLKTAPSSTGFTAPSLNITKLSFSPSFFLQLSPIPSATSAAIIVHPPTQAPSARHVLGSQSYSKMIRAASNSISPGEKKTPETMGKSLFDGFREKSAISLDETPVAGNWQADSQESLRPTPSQTSATASLPSLPSTLKSSTGSKFKSSERGTLGDELALILGILTISVIAIGSIILAAQGIAKILLPELVKLTPTNAISALAISLIAFNTAHLVRLRFPTLPKNLQEELRKLKPNIQALWVNDLLSTSASKRLKTLKGIVLWNPEGYPQPSLEKKLTIAEAQSLIPLLLHLVERDPSTQVKYAAAQRLYLWGLHEKELRKLVVEAMKNVINSPGYETPYLPSPQMRDTILSYFEEYRKTPEESIPPRDNYARDRATTEELSSSELNTLTGMIWGTATGVLVLLGALVFSGYLSEPITSLVISPLFTTLSLSLSLALAGVAGAMLFHNNHEGSSWGYFISSASGILIVGFLNSMPVWIMGFSLWGIGRALKSLSSYGPSNTPNDLLYNPSYDKRDLSSRNNVFIQLAFIKALQYSLLGWLATAAAHWILRFF